MPVYMYIWLLYIWLYTDDENSQIATVVEYPSASNDISIFCPWEDFAQLKENSTHDKPLSSILADIASTKLQQ